MTGLQLVVAVLLLAGNAFFVGAEFAAISVRRATLEPLVDTDARARRVLDSLRSLSMLLAGAQLGITLCSLGLGAVAEPSVAGLLESGFDRLGIPHAVLHPVAFAIALTFVVFLHMVLGEMVPKNLALAAPERLALVMVPVLSAFVRVVRPVILGLNGLANAGLRVLRIERKDEIETSHTAEELAEIIAESRSKGLLDQDESERLTGALALENLRARDVMIPISQLVTVAPSINADELEELAAETGYSRFPVSREGNSDGRAAGGTASPDGATAQSPEQAQAARARSRLNPTRALPALAGRSRPRTTPTRTSAPARSADQHPGRDELLGFVHAKDVLGLSAAARRQPLPMQRLRTMPPLRAEQPLLEVLADLQRIGSHLGQVREAGRTLGVVALEDVVEAFVGEVEDASHLEAELDPRPWPLDDPASSP